jgi:hypothetical protein
MDHLDAEQTEILKGEFEDENENRFWTDRIGVNVHWTGLDSRQRSTNCCRVSDSWQERCVFHRQNDNRGWRASVSVQLSTGTTHILGKVHEIVLEFADIR